MITIHDLLEDPTYKEFFCKVPPKQSLALKPWRVYIQRRDTHAWGFKDFTRYVDAFKFFRKQLKAGNVQDASISSRGLSFAPPQRTVRVKGKYVIDNSGSKVQVTRRVPWEPRYDPLEAGDIRWCVYCRRPTDFKYFTQHRVMNKLNGIGINIDASVKRCDICGASERVNTHG